MCPWLPGRRLCSMDTNMTRDTCDKDILTNSNKAFINFNYVVNERVVSLQLSIAHRQDRESEQIINLLSSEEVTHFKLRRIALVSTMKIGLADGNRRE